MRIKPALFAIPALMLSPALAEPVAAAEVEVTRFHTPESLAGAQPGPIALITGNGFEGSDLEARAWLDAVGAALAEQGFTIDPAATRVARVTLTQKTFKDDPSSSKSGVSVGVGVGSGGGYYGRGSGVNLGLGLGFLLGGKKSRERLITTLEVVFEDAAGTHLWEGRAQTNLKASAKDAQPAKLAPEMAEALFSGFPGESGATIEVK